MGKAASGSADQANHRSPQRSFRQRENRRALTRRMSFSTGTFPLARSRTLRQQEHEAHQETTSHRHPPRQRHSSPESSESIPQSISSEIGFVEPRLRAVWRAVSAVAPRGTAIDSAPLQARYRGSKPGALISCRTAHQVPSVSRLQCSDR